MCVYCGSDTVDNASLCDTCIDNGISDMGRYYSQDELLELVG